MIRYWIILAWIFHCALVVCFLQGCTHLPSDFASLPLDEKILIYEQHLQKWWGHESREARGWISWHGLPAANAMALYLTDQKKGLPKNEAIYIIRAVQRRGCSLRGTEAHIAIKKYLTSKPAPSGLNAKIAKSTLENIVDDFHSQNYDLLPPGPCDSQPKDLNTQAEKGDER